MNQSNLIKTTDIAINIKVKPSRTKLLRSWLRSPVETGSVCVLCFFIPGLDSQFGQILLFSMSVDISGQNTFPHAVLVHWVMPNLHLCSVCRYSSLSFKGIKSPYHCRQHHPTVFSGCPMSSDLVTSQNKFSFHSTIFIMCTRTNYSSI